MGLLRERTGVPVFLVYLEGADGVNSRELNSLDDVEIEIQSASSTWNQSAWEGITPFFEADGAYAQVITLPISGTKETLLKEMIGSDRGLKSRTGIYALRNLIEFADLVVIPQASRVLDWKEHRLFHKALFHLLDELNHYFAIIDFPKDIDNAKAHKWMKNMVAPNAATYFPWLIREGKLCPPGASVAAVYQISDRERGINELPANRVVGGSFLPMLKFVPSDLQRFLENRLNVVHLFGKGEVRIWGGRTLAETLDLDGRFISNRRTLLALREAVHQICEPFVLEPLNDNLPHLVDVAMQSSFQAFGKIFDPGAKQPFRSQVSVVNKDSEDVLQVDIHYSVPYAVDEMAFSLALSN